MIRVFVIKEFINLSAIPNTPTQPPFLGRKFQVSEIRKMMESGILPEESGWELIDGEIIQKMPIRSRHASPVKRLNNILANRVGNEAIISVPDPIHIDEYNEPEPGIALLSPPDDFYAESHPNSKDVRLIMEVSDPTLEYDREVKKAIYAEAEIAEFWLVNLKDNTVETYTNPSNGTYYQMQIFERGEVLQSRTLSF